MLSGLTQQGACDHYGRLRVSASGLETMVISLGVDWGLKIGTGLEFITLLAIVPLRLSASIGGSGKSGIKSLSACNLGQRSCMTFLTLGMTSLYVVTNVRGGFASLCTALGMSVVCRSSNVIGSNSLLVTIGLYPLVLRTRLCLARA